MRHFVNCEKELTQREREEERGRERKTDTFELEVSAFTNSTRQESKVL